MEEPVSEINSTCWKRRFGWIGNAQLAGLIGITSLVLSLYFWIDQKVEPNLYALSDTHNASQIVSASTLDLEVYYKRQLVTGDVFAQQIKVWNRGKRPIKPADILSPILIEVAPSVKLLEARITSQARDVSDCKLSFEDPGSRSASLSTARIITSKIYFTCKILETGDGATIQIIYEGPRDLSLKFIGAIEGQKALLLENRRLMLAEDYSPKSQMKRATGVDPVFIVLGFMGFSLIISLLPTSGNLGKLKAGMTYTFIAILLIFTASAVIYASYDFFLKAPALPPF